jgi:2-oxoglutarate dehydrogenase E1 component
MYTSFQKDPSNIEDGWRAFFQGFEFNNVGLEETMSNGSSNGVASNSIVKELGVLSLIRAFRNRGHLLSTTNPIRVRKDRQPKLDLVDYNLSEADLNTTFFAGTEIGLKNATLQQILDRLRFVYAQKIGVEYSHIQDSNLRLWIRNHVESVPNEDDYGLDIDTKNRILTKLNEATILEEFLDKKFRGQKRFSLEGGDSMIPALDRIILDAAGKGVEEVVIGMAHRGRLNVLANIMQKTYKNIFSEFEGAFIPKGYMGSGDVKYHMGFSSQIDVNGNKVHLKLMPNPSHLESVDSVVQGFARAKADLEYNSNYDKILPILIHGDAAVGGQGVVYETAQMSGLEAYQTGGTIHFVINNQIGFTTDFYDGRTSTYCTAAANAIGAPVFHCNGDDPEGVIHAVKMAVEFRQEFNMDVFIDMVCYRKHGHNEGDDPSFTQPQMYSIIKEHKNPRDLYATTLSERGDVQKDLADQMQKSFDDQLQERLAEVKQKPLPYEYQKLEEDWRSLDKKEFDVTKAVSPKTAIAKTKVKKIINHCVELPTDFETVKKLDRLMKGKNKLLADGKYDWAMGEWLAFGSILLENKNVRMSGQDVERGTFSHRHAIFKSPDEVSDYNRFNNIEKKQGKLRIYNSFLSEFAVMGFEYGYSLATPNDLVIWEAQFGDFYNGAQTIVDQYISSGESKWGRMSGLVLLLPHGFAGQGPEHSSARPERFLQQCAQFNMIVTNITTPANYFHALRRQTTWNYRKPLINMAPKSLLRHPACLSTIEDFTGNTKFQEVIPDVLADVKKAKKLIFCTGKVYYDLVKAREEAGKTKDIAIVRVEQLYPFPQKEVEKLMSSYKSAKDILWVQEEPENMGYWRFVMTQLRRTPIELVSREASASPATGYKKVHDKEQADLIKIALS